MLQIGKAGEHFVCYDLIINGVNAFLADQGLPYDVLADFGNNIKKIQVKTVTKKTILSKGGINCCFLTRNSV
jgi:BioD-like phosphotransacetylase family protein